MRSQRGAVWAYMLLTFALLGAFTFGLYQTRQANRLALDSENKYMSAFHKLKWNSENIEERMGKLMATNDPNQQESLLADLRVYSAQSVENMSVLPFGNLNKPRIENFLNTLRLRSDELNYKLNRGEALSEEDWAQLMELRKQSVVFEEELANLLGLIGSNMIRWRDTARVTGPAQTGSAATPISKSVLTLENALPAPPGEEDALAPGGGPLARPKIDPGPRVDAATAIAAVKRFVDLPLAGEPQVTGSSDPVDEERRFSLYFLNGQKANGTTFNFGVSIHGGHVVYMLDGRPVTEKKLNHNDLVTRARDMLRKRGYETVEFVSAVENDGTLVMDFAPMQNGVAVHTDKVKIMLAMDNGELLGFDARNYWVNRQPRQLSGPKLTAMEAQKRVSPRLKLRGTPQLAVIADRRSMERLTWEVRGSLDNQHFRIYVDAMTGEEVDLIRVMGDPAPPMSEG